MEATNLVCGFINDFFADTNLARQNFSPFATDKVLTTTDDVKQEHTMVIQAHQKLSALNGGDQVHECAKFAESYNPSARTVKHFKDLNIGKPS